MPTLKHELNRVASSAELVTKVDELQGTVDDLKRILKDAVVTGYHACDETVQAIDEPPRGGCRCWVAEARLAIDFEGA